MYFEEFGGLDRQKDYAPVFGVITSFFYGPAGLSRERQQAVGPTGARRSLSGGQGVVLYRARDEFFVTPNVLLTHFFPF